MSQACIGQFERNGQLLRKVLFNAKELLDFVTKHPDAVTYTPIF